MKKTKKVFQIILSGFLLITGMLCNCSEIKAEQIVPNAFVYEMPIAAVCNSSNKVVQYYYGTFTTNKKIVKTCQFFNGEPDSYYHWQYAFVDASGAFYTPYRNNQFSSGYVIYTSNSNESCVSNNVYYDDTECYSMYDN